MTGFLLCGAAAAALFAVAPALAQTAQPGQPAPRAHKVMKPETRAEAQATVAKHFARMDANHDGSISKAELDALTAQRDAKLQQRAEKRAENFDPAKAFARLDTNKDGKITQ